MGHDSTKINHRQNKFGAKRKRKAKKVKISALTDDLESSINDMSFGSEETNESPSALTSLLNDSELLASHDDTDSPVCGGFWLPLYHDLYHGDVRAITNHLEINQTFHMKSKGVKVVRTDDFKNPFLFQCVECTGHVGDKQKFIVENNTKKTICLKCFNFRNHSTFRRHISFLKETKYNIENSLIFKRSLELPSYDSIIDNLSRDDALSLLRLIMQGNVNSV